MESGTELWSVSYSQRLPDDVPQASSLYRRRVEIGRAESLERALATGDKFAETTVGYTHSQQL